jgi:hypothetical protein
VRLVPLIGVYFLEISSLFVPLMSVEFGSVPSGYTAVVEKTAFENLALF